MKKNNRIVTYIGIALVMFGVLALESELSYILTDVIGWSWLINLWHGMTYMDIMTRYLSSPFFVTIMSIEVFVMVPLLACALGDLWLERETDKRATEN